MIFVVPPPGGPPSTSSVLAGRATTMSVPAPWSDVDEKDTEAGTLRLGPLRQQKKSQCGQGRQFLIMSEMVKL